VLRPRVRGEERVPREGVPHRHGVEEGARGGYVAAARECREERVPGDDGAGRERVEEAPGGGEAAAAEERRDRAVVLADKVVGGVRDRCCGAGAGAAACDGSRDWDSRRPSLHQTEFRDRQGRVWSFGPGCSLLNCFGLASFLITVWAQLNNPK
jgi:hypothetical protein